LKLYQKHISPVAETYAYCFLKNHFHLLIRIKDERNLPGFENLKGFKPKIINLSGGETFIYLREVLVWFSGYGNFQETYRKLVELDSLED
jgi:hypothetical protein